MRAGWRRSTASARYARTWALAALHDLALPLDRVAGLDAGGAELAQRAHHVRAADDADVEDVGDDAAQREADRRRAQGVDEGVVPLVAIADATDQRAHLRLHGRVARDEVGDAARVARRDIASA